MQMLLKAVLWLDGPALRAASAGASRNAKPPSPLAMVSTPCQAGQALVGVAAPVSARLVVGAAVSSGSRLSPPPCE
jgi:hypothetical protein